ncbi:MAG: class I SAM-dependent methyltransferase [Actinomycetota bacterium]|nr:class I SAM-dependent methyltransferase [Actinomycetota bacterium]
MGETYEIHLPAEQDLEQNEEFFEVTLDGERRKMRIHDYEEVFSHPGLYEQLLLDELQCTSPEVLATVLTTLVRSDREDPGDLVVLDVGAGTGLLGEELAQRGARALWGVDIIAEAAEAAHRDRPGLYEEYLVIDLADPPPDDHRKLVQRGFTCLTVVAALSFDEVPPRAFAQAWNLVADGAWVAFNIKQEVLADDSEGIGALVGRISDEGVMDRRARIHYRHRMSVQGDPLYYIAFVGRKTADFPLEWLPEG